MAKRLQGNIITMSLFSLLILNLITTAASRPTTQLAVSNDTASTSRTTTNSAASSDTTDYSSSPTNKPHHDCPECEQRKIQCPEKPQQKIFNSCCEPPLNSSQGTNDTGMYMIRTSSFSTAQAWCDMETDEGGWMMIMKRSSNKLSFTSRLMHEFEDGFGSLDGDFWYSLKTVAILTSRAKYELRVDLFRNSNDTQSTAHIIYGSFKVSPVDYTLHIDEFYTPSNLHDSLMQFNGKPFLAKKTHDEQLPQDGLLHLCLEYYDETYGSGWWFAESCVGSYNVGTTFTQKNHELYWYSRGYHRFDKYELRMRRKECSPQHTSTTNSKE